MNLRRYTFKLYPNKAQADALEQQRRLHSALYNAMIEQRATQWAHECQRRGKKERRGITLYDQSKEITKLRAESPEYRALSANSLAETAKRVDLAFKGFFRRARQGAGASSGYPRFKRLDGFCFRESGRGWRFHPHGDNAARIYMIGVPGLVKARGRFPATPTSIKTCSLREIGGTWWISIAAEMMPRMSARAALSGTLRFNLIDEFARLRVDGGCPSAPEETVFIVSDGGIIVQKQVGALTPGADHADSASGGRHPLMDVMKEYSADHADSAGDGRQVGTLQRVVQGVDPAAALQQRMSRCKRGYKRYRKLRRRKAKLQARAARRRREGAHLWSTILARRFNALVVIAPRSIKAVTSSGRGDQRQPGAAVDFKADLNRIVLDQAPAAAIAMLRYKLAERGGSFHLVEDDRSQADIGNQVVAVAKQKRALRRAMTPSNRRV
jgi:putative transposase